MLTVEGPGFNARLGAWVYAMQSVSVCRCVGVSVCRCVGVCVGVLLPNHQTPKKRRSKSSNHHHHHHHRTPRSLPGWRPRPGLAVGRRRGRGPAGHRGHAHPRPAPPLCSGQLVCFSYIVFHTSFFIHRFSYFVFHTSLFIHRFSYIAFHTSLLRSVLIVFHTSFSYIVFHISF